MRLAIALLAGLIGAIPALAEDRALVIGNADYRHAPDLAGSDTAALAGDLRAAGFVTQDGIDLPMAPMSRLIETLARADDAPGARVVALNGRFLHDGRETWFMGSDAGRSGLLTVRAQGVPLSRVMRMMVAGPQGAVLILGTDEQQMPHRRGLQNGIGPLVAGSSRLHIITGTPEGGARALAALAHGASLGQALATDPGLRLLGDGLKSPAPWHSPPPSGAAPPDPDRELWAAAALADSRQAYDAYLARFPAGIFAAAARDRLEQLNRPEEWQASDRRSWLGATVTDSPAGYRGYLAKFPEGRYAGLARQHLAQMQPAGAGDQPRGASRERALALQPGDRAELQRRLARLGHDPGAADGVFGAHSRAAIAEWQRKNALAATGYLTRQQMRMIDRQNRALDGSRRPAGDDTARKGPGSALPGDPGKPRSLAAGRGLVPAEAGSGDAATWRWSRRQDTAAAYETYLERFPAGGHAPEAGERLRTLRLATEAAGREEAALGLDPARRRQIEEQLQLVGMQPGPVDGEFTAETRAALRRYQAARNLRVTGYVTQQTMTNLLMPATP